MIFINYPKPDFKIKNEEGKDFIFDVIRKKWVVLTPEEWVRQNFLQYLIHEKKYPAALFGVEKEIQLAEVKKRFDILIYSADHTPWMMVECKSADVPLSNEVLAQILRYNIGVPAAYLVITNGNECMAWRREGGGLVELGALPLFGE